MQTPRTTTRYFQAILEVDLEALTHAISEGDDDYESSKDLSVEAAVRQELGWALGSGISLVDLKEVNEPTS